REVVPLGSSHGRQVDVRVCLATHHDLREAVVAGRFRADLYHRVAPPEVALPPLRDRLDEIAAPVGAEVASLPAGDANSPALTIHARFVEACMLRPWPGNVRELRKQVRFSALEARAQNADCVRSEHLPANAGQLFEPGKAEEAPPRARDYVR